MNAGRHLMVLLMLASVGVGPAARMARAALDEEVQVEAAFLYNFTRFASWPETAFGAGGSSLVIGVVGQSPFGGALEGLRGVVQGGHPIAVRTVSGVEGAGQCHLLFVPHGSCGEVDGLLGGLKGRSVLTVSDCPGFARAGGAIEFVVVNDTVRFRVNLEAARRANVKLSSQMLGVAIEVVKN